MRRRRLDLEVPSHSTCSENSVARSVVVKALSGWRSGQDKSECVKEKSQQQQKMTLNKLSVLLLLLFKNASA